MKVEERAVDTDGMQQIARIVSNIPESDGNKGSIYAAEDGIHLKVIDLPFAHDKVQVSFTNENIKFWKHDVDGDWRVVKTYTADDDSGWVTLPSGLRVRRIRNIVYISSYIEISREFPMWQPYTIDTLPEGFFASNWGSIGFPALFDCYVGEGIPLTVMVHIYINGATITMYQRDYNVPALAPRSGYLLFFVSIPL